MKETDFAFGAFVGAVVACITIAILAGVADESSITNAACQKLGFSAGHYNKQAGLVCEQWTPAAKVMP